MTCSRLITLTVLAAAGFALTSRPAVAQIDEKKLPSTRNNSSSDVTTWKEIPKGIPKGDVEKAQKHFQAFAKYQADLVSHPLIYKAAQDSSVKFDGDGRPIPSFDTIVSDLDRFLLRPNPANRIASDVPLPKVNADHAVYIRELGAAFDAAFKPIVESHPSHIVRVNAARLYSVLCETGAYPHWATVTGWLTNANTRPEIKYYALQAAANLLSAYDVYDFKSRRHAISKEPRAEADKEIGALVAAVQAFVNNPNTIVPIPGGVLDPAKMPNEADVVLFIRRQAVKTLGQVRFVSLPGPDGKTIYPAVTLARVCVSDASIRPAPGPAECAEAAIGLCNMSPNPGGNPIKGFNADVLAEALTSAMITFASPRATDPTNRSLPWRGYSLRLAEAFKNWRPLWDPLHEPFRTVAPDPAAVPAVIGDTIKRIQDAVLTPIDKVDLAGKPDLGARVDIEGLKAFLKQLQSNPKRTGLMISGVPDTALNPPAAPPKK